MDPWRAVIVGLAGRVLNAKSKLLLLKSTGAACIILNRKSMSCACGSNNKETYETIVKKMLPIYIKGEIIKGFGRGSRELGIPTANFSLDVVRSLPESFQTGIYYGWAAITQPVKKSFVNEHLGTHKCVLSIGWNPFYNNTEKSLETHILHEFGTDLYGEVLNLCISGYLRPERSFDSLEALIAAINSDIDIAKEKLDSPDNLKLKEADFFKNNINDCK